MRNVKDTVWFLQVASTMTSKTDFSIELKY